jgi:uncharacterized protein
MDTSHAPLEPFAGLHIFPHKGAFLAFHPDSFSLFRVGSQLAAVLREMRRHPDLSALSERHGVPRPDLERKLGQIREKISRQTEPSQPAGDEPAADREVSLTLHVSNACNLQCAYCYAQGGDYGMRPRRRMDKAVALRALDRMYANFPKVKHILFFGGEPLLAVDVIETVCQHVEDRFRRGEIPLLPDFKTVTNGTRIDDEAVRVIRRYGIRTTISIDGPRELHDRLRPTKGGKGSYDAARRGFERIVRETGRVPQIEATYTQAHLDAGITMTDVIDFLNREFLFTIGTVANVDLPPDHPLALATGDAQGGTSDALAHLMMAMAEGELPKMERSFLFPVLQFIKRKGTRFTCPIGYNSFDITTEGEIYPCQVFVGKRDFRMGTIEDFDAEAPSEEHRNTRRRLLYADKHASPRCRRCWARPFCTSCPGANLFARNGYSVPRSYCTTTQRWLETVLGLLYDIKSDPRLWKNFLAGLDLIAREMERRAARPPVAEGPAERARTSRSGGDRLPLLA